MIHAPNPAQSGPVLATVKTASRAPSVVAGAVLRPVLTAAERGAPQTQVGTEKRCFDQTKKLTVDAETNRPTEFNWQT